MRLWSSLRNRIALIATAVTFVVLVATALVLLSVQQRNLDSAVDEALEAEIVDLQQELDFAFNRPDGGGRRAPRDFRRNLERFVQSSTNNFQLVGTTGEVALAAGSFDSATAIVDAASLFQSEAPSEFRTVQDERGRRYRVISSVVGSDAALIVGYSLDDADQSQRSLRRTLLFLLPLLAVSLGLVIWYFLGRALAPVNRMRSEVDAISASELDARLTPPETTELSALAGTMNSMLARLEGSAQRQNQFVADASHELRSPLTGIRTQLEVNIAHPEAPGREEAEREMLEETIRMQTLVEDLLVLARSDSSERELRTSLLDLDDLIGAELPRHGSSTKRIDASAVQPVQISGNGDQLRRLIRNLLSNAVRHAEETVTVSLSPSAIGAALDVADDGPGVPADLQAGIFERFVRSDEARDRDSGGSGLGLAICRTIAESHGGSIRLEPPNRFVVDLPATPPQRRSRGSDSMLSGHPRQP